MNVLRFATTSRRVVLSVFALLCTLVCCSAHAQLVSLGENFRISIQGSDWKAANSAFFPSVVQNSADNEYFVAWRGSSSSGRGIYGQRLDGNGNPRGGSFLINTEVDSGPTSISYNSVHNEYLVTWQGFTLIDDEYIDDVTVGQRVDSLGNLLGDVFPISDRGNYRTWTPISTFNATENEYLVTWRTPGTEANGVIHNEIYGQRIDGAGNLLGDNYRIGMQGYDGGDRLHAFSPSVIYNPTDNEYLVSWHGERIDSENEVYGQRLNGNGDLLSGNFRISTQGPEGDIDFDAVSSDVSYNSLNNEYLVTWSGDRTDGLSEIYGQLIDSSGNLLGDNFPISTQGPDGVSDFGSSSTSVTYNPTGNEYLVTWRRARIAGELEIYGQRVDSNGSLLGTSLRISTLGTDGDINSDAFEPSVVFNALDNEYLVIWRGRESIDQEFQVFGQRLRILAVPEPSGVFLASASIMAVVGFCRPGS